jgi:hypothetical protein
MYITQTSLTIGTVFPYVINGFNNFNLMNNGSYILVPKIHLNNKKIFEQIVIENLNNNMPIILSYGISQTPLSFEVIEGANAGKNIKIMHMMNVIGMKTDNITKNTKLIIASWSRKIEIDLDEYLNNQGVFGGIACFQKTLFE